MKVVVIGLGSMGKRRIRLLQQFDDTIEIFGVDTNLDRRELGTKEYDVKTFNTLKDLLDENIMDCAFICTSPLSHYKIISECLDHKLHVFSELNLVSDGYEENIALAKKNNVILFLSSTFLYRDEIKKIKSSVEEANCLLNYTYHVGQYLPDWHPWENYKDFFVGEKRSNGCREIFAIELPWLENVFGKIASVKVVKNKISNLNIDYNDNYLVIFQHNTGYKGTMAVDVVSRKPVRNLEVFGEELYLHWDGSPKGLTVFDFENKKDVNIELYNNIDQLENYSSFIVENAYFNEIVSFFEVIKHKEEPLYSFEKDLEILKIIDKIEDSSDA